MNANVLGAEPQNCSSSKDSELNTILQALKAVKDKVCRHVLLGLKCHSCVEAINNRKPTLSWELKYFLTEIQETCSSFDLCICLWVDRTKVQIAHELAQYDATGFKTFCLYFDDVYTSEKNMYRIYPYVVC